ncbi:MAG: cation transporting ATPase C-terminal domain-containing protein [Halioglobus sp.]
MTAVVALQLLFTYAPFMHRFFGSAPVTIDDGLRVIACGALLLLVLELEKRLRRWLRNRTLRTQAGC